MTVFVNVSGVIIFGAPELLFIIFGRYYYFNFCQISANWGANSIFVLEANFKSL